MPYHGRFFNTRKDNNRSPSPRSPNRRRSPLKRSPVGKRSTSPFRRKSRSPVRRKLSRSPRRRFSKSPIRKNSRSPKRKFSRSPIRKKTRKSPVRKSRSPRRRSPVRKYSPPHRRRNLSQSPVRSPVRKSPPSPIRRVPDSPGRGRKRRSRSKSPLRSRDDRLDHKDKLLGYSPEHTRSFNPSSSFSPNRKSPDYFSRSVAERLGPVSPNTGPKIIRDTSGLRKIEPMIIRKKTLSERFRTAEDGHFRIDENITIGIQRNPYAPASTSVTVQKVFDPYLFFMIHNRDSGKQPIFDRPELKYFRFDDIHHDEDEEEYEKRTIIVAPSSSRSDSSRYQSRRSRSPSPRRPTEVRLEMRPDPKYEKMYEEKRLSRIIDNPNDLRHNIAKRHDDGDRHRIDAPRRQSRDRDSRGDNSHRSLERKRSRSRSRSRSPGYRDRGGRNQNRNNQNNDRKIGRGNFGRKSPEKEEVPDFSRRPDRSKYEAWANDPSKIPKGVKYFQHDNRDRRNQRNGRGSGSGRGGLYVPERDPRDSKPPTKLLRPAPSKRGVKAKRGAQRGRNTTWHFSGKNLADRGQWKHDLFEQHVKIDMKREQRRQDKRNVEGPGERTVAAGPGERTVAAGPGERTVDVGTAARNVDGPGERNVEQAERIVAPAERRVEDRQMGDRVVEERKVEIKADSKMETQESKPS